MAKPAGQDSLKAWTTASEPQELEPMAEQLASGSTPPKLAYNNSRSSPFLATPSPSQELAPAISASRRKQANAPDSGHLGRITDGSNCAVPCAAGSARHGPDDIAALSTQLLVMALEEENDRLRSTLEAERRSRQNAEAEMAMHAARACDSEQLAREVSALLVEAQRRVAELEQEASSRAFVQTWLDSAPAHRCGFGGGALGDRPEVQARDCTRAASAPVPIAAATVIAATATATVAASAFAAAAAAIAGVVADSGGHICDCSTADVCDAACGLRSEENGSLGTCLYTSGFEPSSDVDSEPLDLDSPAKPLRCGQHYRGIDAGGGVTAAASGTVAAEAVFFTPAKEHCYCHISRRTDAGVGAAGSYDNFAPDPLQRAHTAGSVFVAGAPLWGSQQQQQYWALRRQPPLLSTPPISRALAANMGPPHMLASASWSSLRGRAGVQRNWAGESMQGAAASASPSPQLPFRSQSQSQSPAAAWAADQFCSTGFQGVPGSRLQADRGRQLVGGSLRHTHVISDGCDALGGTPRFCCSTAHGLLVEGDDAPGGSVGGEWCTIPLGSPARTPKKGPIPAAEL